MRNSLLSFFCLAFFGNVHAQSNVIDFFSAMTFVPIEKKMLVMDVIYNNGEFSFVQKRLVKSKKPSKNVKNNYNLMGEVIDSLELFNYQSDTIYILSTYYFNSPVSELFKTRKDTFHLIKNEAGKYNIQYMNDYYTSQPEDVRMSDSLLYNAVFTWNINMLTQLIMSSGGLLSSEYSMSATRIILKNKQILKKDIINFEPALRWKLE